MVDPTVTERLRLVEMDYDHTNDFVKSVVSTTATLRSLGVTLWLGLLGFAVQQYLWELAALAVIVGLIFFVLDGYHGWLYAKAFAHLVTAETVINKYYETLSRGKDLDAYALEFLVGLRSYQFGTTQGIPEHGFQWKGLMEARPKLLYRYLYPFLIGLALLLTALLAGGVISN
jgi:hypothetical protein